ncbi:MAG: glutathione S-transferase [Granulosicoccaceae bacterium]
MSIPLLYNFRRCPYAIRARLALYFAEIEVQKHEVSFKDKPPHMLEISPKGTVPVLQLPDATVIDESLDIALWALGTNDPLKLLRDKQTLEQMLALVEINDGEFKHWLDHYKYADRHPEQSAAHYRAQAEPFLASLDEMLSQHPYLIDQQPALADILILPFVRQFAHVDRAWFAQTPWRHLQTWLAHWLTSQPFETVMIKAPKA